MFKEENKEINVMNADYEKSIQTNRNELNNIDSKIHKLKEPQNMSFSRISLKWLKILFVAWPIVTYILETAFTIIHLIIGIIIRLLFNFDITSKGTQVSDFIGGVLYPYNDIFFYPLLTWRYFWLTLFVAIGISFIIKQNNLYQLKKFEENISFLNKEMNEINKKLNEETEKFEKENRKKRIKFEREQEAKGLMKYRDKWGKPEDVKTWKEIDVGLSNNFANLNHFEFETFIAKLFQKMGYQTEVTRKTGDYGVDVIAKKDDDVIAIQVKKNSHGNNVGDSVVQNTLGGMWKYKANKAIIITTSDFTTMAHEQARSAPIELWNKKTLHQMVRKYFVEQN